MTCSSEAEQAQVQAAFLVRLAQEARLVRFALESDDLPARELAQDFELALELAVDADDEAAQGSAQAALAKVLEQARARGLAVSAGLSDMQVEGVLGAQRLRVLTAVMAPYAARNAA
ncbi:MAG TPA: hypothetical protein P5024_03470 [Burkholderiaceae bacterium]|jgi:hypothetical protein|nr:hypothetical protein [Burkholderiaceae bacterium]HPE01366.1 hypothetical protein [Burkholderiaceae bacterium]HRZ00591.1 hypothetical protein [Burkholderiaceae bacterium]